MQAAQKTVRCLVGNLVAEVGAEMQRCPLVLLLNLLASPDLARRDTQGRRRPYVQGSALQGSQLCCAQRARAALPVGSAAGTVFVGHAAERSAHRLRSKSKCRACVAGTDSCLHREGRY